MRESNKLTIPTYIIGLHRDWEKYRSNCMYRTACLTLRIKKHQLATLPADPRSAGSSGRSFVSLLVTVRFDGR